MSKNHTKPQSGMVAIEIALLVMVVAIFGFIYYRTYLTKTKTANAPVTTKVANTTPDGSVDHAVNAVSQTTDQESSLSQDSSDVTQLTGSETDASNVEGSFNENDF